MRVLNGDYKPREFARMLRRKRPSYPMTDLMEEGRHYKAQWYSCQREHVVAFLMEYDGPGAYNRKNYDGTARRWYNSFQCPPGLIWVAEAVGVDHKLVEQAAKESLAAQAEGKRQNSQCAAIRRVISWATVYEATLR